MSDLITHFGFENVKNDNIKYYQVDFEIPEQIFSTYEKIKNDYELSLLSITLEFSLDLVGVIFLFLVIFLEFLMLIF